MPYKNKEDKKNWLKNNKEKVSQTKKAWRARNPQKSNQSSKKWKLANPTKVQAQKRRQHQKNKDYNKTIRRTRTQQVDQHIQQDINNLQQKIRELQ